LASKELGSVRDRCGACRLEACDTAGWKPALRLAARRSSWEDRSDRQSLRRTFARKPLARTTQVLRYIGGKRSKAGQPTR